MKHNTNRRKKERRSGQGVALYAADRRKGDRRS